MVVFELMSHRWNHHIGRIDHLEKCDVARVSERDDEFPQKWALAGLATREGRCLQGRNTCTNGDNAVLGQFQIATSARKLPSAARPPASEVLGR